MSQMSNLATILDEMTQTGKAMIGCGESLIKTTVSIKRWLEAEYALSETPVTNPGNPNMSPSTSPMECPDTYSAKSSPEPAKTTRAPKGKTKTTASTNPTEHEPEPEEAGQKEPSLPAHVPPAPLSKEEARAMLADLAQSGHREEAKALVAKYANGGSFSDIDPERYPELAEEVKKIHG